MSRVRGAVVGVRRRWWVAALLILLVALGSLIQYYGPGARQRDAYLATRSLRIVVLSANASTAYDAYVASRQEDEIARALTTAGTLSAAWLDDAIAARMRADHLALPLSSQTIATALSATHSGNLVTLTTQGRSAAEADALATAAAEVLSSTTLASVLPPALVPPSGDYLGVRMEGSIGQPTHDTTQDQAAVAWLLERVGLACVVGLCLAFIADGMLRRRRMHPAA